MSHQWQRRGHTILECVHDNGFLLVMFSIISCREWTTDWSRPGSLGTRVRKQARHCLHCTAFALSSLDTQAQEQPNWVTSSDMAARVHPSHAAASSGAVLVGNVQLAGEPQQRRFDPYSVSWHCGAKKNRRYGVICWSLYLCYCYCYSQWSPCCSSCFATCLCPRYLCHDYAHLPHPSTERQCARTRILQCYTSLWTPRYSHCVHNNPSIQPINRTTEERS